MSACQGCVARGCDERVARGSVACPEHASGAEWDPLDVRFILRRRVGTDIAVLISGFLCRTAEERADLAQDPDLPGKVAEMLASPEFARDRGQDVVEVLASTSISWWHRNRFATLASAPWRNVAELSHLRCVSRSEPLQALVERTKDMVLRVAIATKDAVGKPHEATAIAVARGGRILSWRMSSLRRPANLGQ